MAVRLSLYYAAIFLAIGIMMPFWPVWLQGRGMSPAEIGIILSTGGWVRAVTNPLLAQFADRKGRPDRMVAALGWITLALFLAYTVVDGFWPILAVSIVAGVASSAMFPLGDAVTMLKVREGLVDYGRVRLWGSITFVFATLAGGHALTGQPTELILWLVIGCLVVQLGAAHLLPEARTAGTARFGTPLIETVRDRPFLLFLAIASLLQASHAAYYGFATLHWLAAGYNKLAIGALWAEAVLAEIVLFALARRAFARVSPFALLALGAAAGVVRWTALGWTSDLAALALVQLLHAFTFGAAHIAVMHHIARTIPAAYGATAQSIYSSFSAMAMAASTIASGWLYAGFRGSAFYAMAVLSVAGGLAVALLARRSRDGSGRG